jgi:membrane protein DedA with SNARE-associated domain
VDGRWSCAGPLRRDHPERLARVEGFFARHGGKSVFLARFVPWIRAFGALVAGIANIHRRSFFYQHPGRDSAGYGLGNGRLPS